MKPQLLKISSNPAFSFQVRHDRVPYFYDKWHYHPEVELVYIIKGTGTQFIGNDIDRFQPGDMIMVGANLPHLWRCDQQYYEGKEGRMAESSVLHFAPQALGEPFWQMPENKAFHELLERARLGVVINGAAKKAIVRYMKQLESASEHGRTILLLQILEAATGQQDTRTILSPTTHKEDFHDKAESERMNRIYQFIFNNFQQKISLEDIAGVAHISPHSFCRFFKSKTKKSFSTFLTEVRIHHACKLLAETDHPVSDICYESGFNNFSNFNRHFKLLKNKSPLQHRQQYQQPKKGISL